MSGASFTGIVALMVGSSKPVRKFPSGNQLSQAERNALKPLRKARADLGDVVRAHSSVPEVKVVGTDALAQADLIMLQCLDLIRTQIGAKRVVSGREKSEKELADLELRLTESKTVSEQESLERAADSQRRVLQQVGEFESHVQIIEGRLREATAILLELKVRLVGAALRGSSAGDVTDELTQHLSELKSLSQSLEETQVSLGQNS